jgi:hypothetical protein
MLLCVHGSCQRTYFDTADVVKVEEPVDIAAGWKPAGWADEYAALLTLRGNAHHPILVPVRHREWPAVRAALGLAGAADIEGGG